MFHVLYFFPYSKALVQLVGFQNMNFTILIISALLTLAFSDLIFPVPWWRGILAGSSYLSSTFLKKLLRDSSYVPCCEQI